MVLKHSSSIVFEYRSCKNFKACVIIFGLYDPAAADVSALFVSIESLLCVIIYGLLTTEFGWWKYRFRKLGSVVLHEVKSFTYSTSILLLSLKFYISSYCKVSNLFLDLFCIDWMRFLNQLRFL